MKNKKAKNKTRVQNFVIEGYHIASGEYLVHGALYFYFAVFVLYTAQYE